MTGDQMPLPHCWKEVPPTQFHWPSGLHALPAVMAPADEPVVAPELPVPELPVPELPDPELPELPDEPELPDDPELALVVAAEAVVVVGDA
jgi:hypothetical protein